MDDLPADVRALFTWSTMRHEVIFDLADCTTFRQTLLARPPAIVHGTALLLAVQIAFQLRRMHNEEVILGEIFPEYAAYQRRTARLLPGIY